MYRILLLESGEYLYAKRTQEGISGDYLMLFTFYELQSRNRGKNNYIICESLDKELLTQIIEDNIREHVIFNVSKSSYFLLANTLVEVVEIKDETL